MGGACSKAPPPLSGIHPTDRLLMGSAEMTVGTTTTSHMGSGGGLPVEGQRKGRWRAASQSTESAGITHAMSLPSSATYATCQSPKTTSALFAGGEASPDTRQVRSRSSLTQLPQSKCFKLASRTRRGRSQDGSGYRPSTGGMVEDMRNGEADKEAGGGPRSWSKVMLDDETTKKLRTFYDRNRKEQQRHATMMANSEALDVMKMLAEAEGGKEKVEKFDVFSPDMRSTRWQEFLDLFAENMDQYDKYKETSRAVRGAGKAMTLAAVTRQSQENLGRLH